MLRYGFNMEYKISKWTAEKTQVVKEARATMMASRSPPCIIVISSDVKRTQADCLLLKLILAIHLRLSAHAPFIIVINPGYFAGTASFAVPQTRFPDDEFVIKLLQEERANEDGWSSARENLAPRPRVSFDFLRVSTQQPCTLRTSIISVEISSPEQSAVRIITISKSDLNRIAMINRHV